MKKTFKLIATLLCVAAMTIMWSCNTNQSSNSNTNNNPTSSSNNNATNVSKSESVTPPKTSFTASNGRTYSFSEVEKKWYDWGTSQGSRCQGFGYHFNGFGTEDYFKGSWVSDYGIPESVEAKEAYNRSLKKYKEGYDAGYKF